MMLTPGKQSTRRKICPGITHMPHTQRCSSYLTDTTVCFNQTAKWWALYRKAIVVHCWKHSKDINALCGKNAEVFVKPV
jgi:hypothetical protein